jgi:excisionase family DNA binding protein
MTRRPAPQPVPPPSAPEPLHLEPLAYCVEDAALVLALSRTTVYELIKEGLLKTVHRGKRRIIPRTEIQAYLDKHAA